MFDLSRQTLTAHSTDMRQFIDCRASTLPDGSRILDVHNSSGLNFTLLPDRGLDIWSAQYKGVPLTWISQSSPHRPDYGSGWARQFNGGLLTTCGLSHVGHPETDDVTGEERDLHGNFTRLPAQMNVIDGAWESDDNYIMTIKATLSEARFSGEQFHVERTYRVPLGQPEIHITDRVTNLKDTPVPFMFLYHINVGYPLVRDGSHLLTPSVAVKPRDPRAAEGFEQWAHYDRAQTDYSEQVYFHQVNMQDESTQVLFTNGEIGLSAIWDTRTMPYFTQWKNVQHGVYVCGVEPGNCVPEGQNAARAAGRLQMLNGGETQTFDCRLRIEPDAAALDRNAAIIDRIRTTGQPTAGFKMDMA